MKVLKCIWVLKKCTHWIKVSEHRPVLCTNHSTILALSKQPNVVNSTAASVNNKKLIYALEFISTFKINFLHKPGRENVIPNALSRLPSPNKTAPETPRGLKVLPDDRDEHWSFFTEMRPIASATPSGADLQDGNIHVKISSDFHKHLQDSYREDPQ